MDQATAQELDLQTHELKKAALVLRAVNHNLRQNLIRLIHASGSITVTELYEKLKLEQSVASQHLAILRKAGFVLTERKGKFVYYKINYNAFNELDVFTKKILN